MLGRCKTIGHARNKIGHHAGTVTRRRRRSAGGVRWLHGVRRSKESIEQLSHHHLGPIGGLDHLRVPVEVVEQKPFEGLRLQPHLRSEPHQGGRAAHCVDITRRCAGDGLLR